MPDPTYTLKDGELAAQIHPQTFMIPPLARRRNLRLGQLVKLGFEATVEAAKALANGCNGERMWVEITKVSGPGEYTGKLESQPAFPVLWCGGLKVGDEVRFSAKHVLSHVPAPTGDH